MSNKVKPARKPRTRYKALLWESGVRQKDIAERTGYDPSYVSRVLNGTRPGTPGERRILEEIESVTVSV